MLRTPARPYSPQRRTMTDEIWKPIPGHLGYEVSDMGRVRSLKRQDAHILKPSRDPKGYYGVGLCNDGKMVFKKVHYLVMLTFVGPRPDGLETCHGPGGQGDNRLGNLRYDTHLANMREIAENPRRKLTNEEAREIRDRFQGGGVSASELAKEYNVKDRVIYNLLRGTHYTLAGGEMNNAIVSKYKRAEVIREEYFGKRITMKELASRYNISISAVSLIISGRNCKYAGGPLKGKDY